MQATWEVSGNEYGNFSVKMCYSEGYSLLEAFPRIKERHCNHFLSLTFHGDEGRPARLRQPDPPPPGPRALSLAAPHDPADDVAAIELEGTVARNAPPENSNIGPEMLRGAGVGPETESRYFMSGGMDGADSHAHSPSGLHTEVLAAIQRETMTQTRPGEYPLPLESEAAQSARGREDVEEMPNPGSQVQHPPEQHSPLPRMVERSSQPSTEGQQQLYRSRRARCWDRLLAYRWCALIPVFIGLVSLPPFVLFDDGRSTHGFSN